jgi:hypothetical protein
MSYQDLVLAGVSRVIPEYLNFIILDQKLNFVKEDMLIVIWVLMPCSLLGGYQCFGGAYHLHLSTHKMEAISSSKMLITTYKTTWQHNQEDYSSHLLLGGWTMWIWAVLLTYQKNILPPPGPK